MEGSLKFVEHSPDAVRPLRSPSWPSSPQLLSAAAPSVPTTRKNRSPAGTEFHVKLRKPTPSTKPIRLVATVTESTAQRATIETTLECDGVLTSTCRGVFVAVKEGHPAYHRW